MAMNAYLFSIFKSADRACYSVSFKDPNGKYLRPISTGKKNEADALQIALMKEILEYGDLFMRFRKQDGFLVAKPQGNIVLHKTAYFGKK